MIEARVGRNTHRFICTRPGCHYEGLWLRSREQAQHDAYLHNLYAHKDNHD